MSGSTDSGVMKLSIMTATSRAPWRRGMMGGGRAASQLHAELRHAACARLPCVMLVRRCKQRSQCPLEFPHPDNFEDVAYGSPPAWLGRSVEHLLNACAGRPAERRGSAVQRSNTCASKLRPAARPTVR